MKYVYELLHRHKVEQDEDGSWICDTKIIGIYSTKKKAKETRERYKHITGFKDYPNDFEIKKIKLDFEIREYR